MGYVYKELDFLDAPITEHEIDRAHRTGSKHKDENGKWQQPTLLKFTSLKSRNELYKLRKYSNFHITADLTSRNEQVLSYAREQLRKVGSLANQFIKFVYADPNSTLMAFTYTGRFLRFNSETEFHDIALHVDNTSKISETIYNMIGEDFQVFQTPGE